LRQKHVFPPKIRVEPALEWKWKQVEQLKEKMNLKKKHDFCVHKKSFYFFLKNICEKKMRLKKKSRHNSAL